MGTIALTGTCAFERNSNCTDPSQPMNAWGVGAVQAELQTALNSDTSIIALGLSEAWTCATPSAVLKALGWAAQVGERNGVSLLARYGFSGPAEWFQLDTSLNANPADTMWVVRAPVCADAACSRSVQVFSAHWYASGDTRIESFDRQAQGTVDAMATLPASEPRVLIGDMNVWDEPGTVCGQDPVPTAVQILSDAGNLDGWPSVHGTAEGYTGMWNRNGCGVPNGYLWKRIDRAWSKSLPPPVSMTRFGMVTPGTCAPSDHAGIIVEYPWPGAAVDTTAPTVSITAPVDGSTLSGVATLTADASDDTGVSRVGFTVDGTIVGEDTTAPYAFAWDTTGVADGLHTITAWASDAAGNTGSSASVSITVHNAPPPTPFDFSLSVTPSVRKVKAGATTSYTVTSTLLSGTAEAVSLAVSGVPAGVTASFAPASITGTGSSTLTITTAKTTPVGTYALTITGTGGGLQRSSLVSLQVVKRR
jgi:hypothetical protein